MAPGALSEVAVKQRVSFLLVALVLTALMVACGAAGTGQQDPLARFNGARSGSCASVTGLAALYWDYMNGLPRVDYPETIRQVPFDIGGWVTNPVQPLYSLVYPAGWTGQYLVDPGIQQTGLHVFRQDGHALWHRRNETMAGTFAASVVANAVVQEFYNLMAPGAALEVVCSLDSAPGQLQFDRSSRIVSLGGYVANVSVQTAYLAGGTTSFIQVALAPDNEYGGFLYFVAFPLTAQMGPGGGGTEPECNDGIDNDGDGLIDYPNDPQCSSPLDDSEAG